MSCGVGLGNVDSRSLGSYVKIMIQLWLAVCGQLWIAHLPAESSCFQMGAVSKIRGITSLWAPLACAVAGTSRRCDTGGQHGSMFVVVGNSSS